MITVCPSFHTASLQNAPWRKYILQEKICSIFFHKKISASFFKFPEPCDPENLKNVFEFTFKTCVDLSFAYRKQST